MHSNLSTATPAEIDSQLADLDRAAHGLEKRVDAAVLSLRSALGQKSKTWGRGASKVTEWPTTTAEAIAAMRAKGEEYVGMGRTAASVVKRYDDAVADLETNRGEQAPLEAEWARRPWTRFYVVQGGHIHKTRYCSTCNRGQYRTQFGWMPDMSGMDEAEALTMLAKRAHVLCTVCFPNAPVVAPDKVAPTHCLGSGRPVVAGTIRGGSSSYGDCAVCTDRPLVVGGNVARKHKAKDLREPAEAAPMIEQPQHAGRDEQPAPTARAITGPAGKGTIRDAAAMRLRVRLATIGQITRELTYAQVAELGDLLAEVTPAPRSSGAPSVPFLAARVILRAGECRCVTGGPVSPNCEAHPGYTSRTAALAAIAAALVDQDATETEAGEDAAAAGATWATWDGHGRPAAAILYGSSGMIHRAEPVTIAEESALVVARSVGGRYVTTAIASAEWLLAVPEPAGDAAACRFCGCTEDRACLGGCAWASDEQIQAVSLEPMDGDVCTACLPARGAGMSRQQAYLERDQDQDDEGDEARDCVRVSTRIDENGQRWQWCAHHRKDEAIAPEDDAPALPAGALPLTADPAPGSWYGWRAGRRVCVFPARSTGDNAIRSRAVDSISPAEHYKPRVTADDAELAAAADADAGVAEVLAIAGCATTVTITDPAGLLSMIVAYGERHARWRAATPQTHTAGEAEADQAEASAILALIARTLGVQLGEPAAAAVPAPRAGGDVPPVG